MLVFSCLHIPELETPRMLRIKYVHQVAEFGLLILTEDLCVCVCILLVGAVLACVRRQSPPSYKRSGGDPPPAAAPGNPHGTACVCCCRSGGTGLPYCLGRCVFCRWVWGLMSSTLTGFLFLFDLFYSFLCACLYVRRLDVSCSCRSLLL